MTYRVIANFKDLQDDNYRYAPGDVFPRDGRKIAKKRLAELMSPTNKLGKPVIEEVVEEAEVEAEVNEEKDAD